MIGCTDCLDAQAEIERLKDENERLLRALHRESEHWNRRAPHTGKATYERYGHGPHVSSN